MSQVHEVAFGKHHGSIKFKPENQSLYEGVEGFQKDPKDGKLYTTMGAGYISGKLVSEPNRVRDFEQSNKVLETVSLVSPQEEDQVYQELKSLDSKLQR